MTARILLIADDAFDDLGDLPSDLREVVGDADSVHVVAPTTGNRLATLTEDESIYEDAIARARRVAGVLEDAGVRATSDHSESAPLETAQAKLKAEEYDAVVVACTPDGHWREEGLLDDLRGSTEVPVHKVRLDG